MSLSRSCPAEGRRSQAVSTSGRPPGRHGAGRARSQLCSSVARASKLGRYQGSGNSPGGLPLCVSYDFPPWLWRRCAARALNAAVAGAHPYPRRGPTPSSWAPRTLPAASTDGVLPRPCTRHVGDTVHFRQNSNEIHTVTFLGGAELPGFVVPPQASAFRPHQARWCSTRRWWRGPRLRCPSVTPRRGSTPA